MGVREDLVKLSLEMGPRPACSQGEERAARYIEERFRAGGLEVSVQQFGSTPTYSYLYVIYLSVAVACAVLSYWFIFVIAPVALADAALFMLDLETFPVLSKILPRRTSRNVIGEIPSEDGRVSVVVSAHYDSSRASLSFHPRMVKCFRGSFNMMVAALFSVAALAVANLVVRLSTGEVNLWVWVAGLVPAAYLLVPLFLLLHRETAMDVTAGANDNASGVAVMLALMDKMSEPESLKPGTVFVATGAEEAGTVGMIEFLKEYRGRLEDARIINLDNLGTGRLHFIEREGMLLPRRSDPVLLWLSGRVAEDKGFPVARCGFRLLSTDATPALARGFKAMSLMAFDEDGRLPNWHWETDTVDNVDTANLETARGFIWNVVRKLYLD